MHEIICPHCKKAFKIDESGYAEILKQVHDSEFEQQLHERLELAENDKKNAVELTREKINSEMQKTVVARDSEIQGFCWGQFPYLTLAFLNAMFMEE